MYVLDQLIEEMKERKGVCKCLIPSSLETQEVINKITGSGFFLKESVTYRTIFSCICGKDYTVIWRYECSDRSDYLEIESLDIHDRINHYYKDENEEYAY